MTLLVLSKKFEWSLLFFNLPLWFCLYGWKIIGLHFSATFVYNVLHKRRWRRLALKCKQLALQIANLYSIIFTYIHLHISINLSWSQGVSDQEALLIHHSTNKLKLKQTYVPWLCCRKSTVLTFFEVSFCTESIVISMAINRQGDLTEKIFLMSNITKITHYSLTVLHVHLNIFSSISK